MAGADHYEAWMILMFISIGILFGAEMYALRNTWLAKLGKKEN